MGVALIASPAVQGALVEAMNMKTRFIPLLVASLAALSPVARAQVSITFDYSLDSSGFFGNSAARAVLDSAASALQSRLADTLDAISPGGGNSWSANFANPATGTQTSVTDLNVPANTLIIYVGAHNLGGSTLGQGGFGGFSGGGSQAWIDTLSARGESGAPSSEFGPWGGSIAFNDTAAWYFDSNPSTVESFSGNDFYSVALHELGHVLGIGTAQSWDNLITGGNFTGAVSMSLNGGPVPLTVDGGHWANGLTSTLPGTATGQEPAMDPDLTVGTRKFFTDLDFGGLDDLGWDVTPVPEPQTYALVAGLGLLVFALCRRRAAALN
jgi:hypothetical protein